MPITQEITNLLNGVSQAPPHLRDPSQGEEQVNAMSHRTRGLRVRPPTEHVAKLSSSPVGWDSAADFTLDRSATQRYRFILANGDLKAYNINTGAEVTVYFPNGKAYLTGSQGFRATQIGDKLVVLNRGMVTKKSATKKAPDTIPQALIQVKAADYETAYSITLQGITYSYKTPASSVTNARTALGTDAIATRLASLVSTAAGFTVTQFGSVLHVQRADNTDFTISGTDGLGGIALQVLKGSIQQAVDLPLKAKAGVVLEVIGSPESDVDNYFVQYDDSASPTHAGVWKEIIKPGLLTALDETTFPHVLEYQGFMFGETIGQGAPSLPSVGTGGTTETPHGWTSLLSGGALTEANNYVVRAHNDGYSVSPAEFNGTLRTVRVKYDIDLRFLANTETAVANFYVGGVLRDSKSYITPDDYKFGETMTWTGSPAAADTVQLKLTYLSGVTPAGAEAILWGLGNNAEGPGVLDTSNFSAKLTFDPAYKYPAGLTLTATLNGTPFAYAVGATDQTGAQVATGLSALIDADAGFVSSNPSSGVVLMTTTPGAVPTTLIASNFSELTTFHAPTLAMVPGAQVGGTIKNKTDGSSGVITANTATTVTVAAMTGGADNKLQAGDSVGITAVSDYFVLSPSVWITRAAGDDTTVPFPSFIERSIDEVFFYQNRLGFTSRDSIVLSQSGGYFNLFRTTATQLLSDDVIDVRSAVRKVSNFNGAVEWTDGLYLTSDQDVFRLSGTPALTPTSVRLDFMGAYQSHPNVRPLALPGHLALASVKNGATRLAFATIQPRVVDDPMLDFKDITEHVPTYIVGNPLAMACDPKAQFIAVLTDGAARRSLYVCLYDIANGQFSQLSWSRWDFAQGSTVVGIDVLNGIVGLVMKRSDGAFLETLTLDPQQATPDSLVLLNGAMSLDGSFYLDGTLI